MKRTPCTEKEEEEENLAEDEVQPMSRSQEKKIEKFKLLTERNRERRPIERQKRREKYKLDRQNGGISKDEKREEQLDRLRRAQGKSLKVCVDLQYEHLMIEKELNHLANQLKRVYSCNKASPSPFDLFFTSLDEEGEIYKTCVAKNVGFAEYIVTREQQGVLDLFRGEEVVYLSPDAEEELEGLDENTVYVIGGLVDDSVKSQVTLNYSLNLGIRCCRLPIGRYMQRASTGTYKQILTINQIFEILLKFHETGDWRLALGAGVPPKTGFVLKQT